MDLLPTFARIAGGSVPADRIIDGVDQTDFFLGKQEESNRESVVIYVGNQLFGLKWRNWKMMTREIDDGLQPTLMSERPIAPGTPDPYRPQ
jgi:arylsulfatase